MSFKFNIKRGTTVLECPYCRKNIKPLPDKTGYNHCQFIHDGVSIVTVNSSKLFQWTSNHEGAGYCKYCKNGSFCNVKFGDWGNGPNKNMCYNHKNYIHYGNNYCKACKSGKYCNNLLKSDSSKNYCWKHLDLENQIECSHIKINGNKCGVLTFNKTGICDKHKLVVEKVKLIKCKEVFKSGKHKGNTCNVINCKRHNKMNSDTIINNKEDLIAIINYAQNALVSLSKESIDLNEKDNNETINKTEVVNHSITNNNEASDNNEVVNNTAKNYNIVNLDESYSNISYLCADIGSLINDLSDYKDILVENSLQVIKSLLISLKNNNKLNK
jgi:hypothetical protein